MRTSVGQPSQTMSMKVSHQNVAAAPEQMRNTQPPRMASSTQFKSNKAVGVKGNKSRTVKTAQSQQTTQMGAIKAKKDMDALRKKFNDELLLVLEEEQNKENQRENQIQNIANPQEAALLEQQFGLERAKASQKIIDISNQHEQVILREMRKLGLL